MNIEFLKTAKYSIHPTWGPIIVCVEGAEEEINDGDAEALIAAGYAEECEQSEDENQDDENAQGQGDKNELDENAGKLAEGAGDQGSQEGNSDQSGAGDEKAQEKVDDDDEPHLHTSDEAQATLETLISTLTDESEAKQIIQDWGTVNAGVKVDKRSSIEGMITEICNTFQ